MLFSIWPSIKTKQELDTSFSEESFSTLGREARPLSVKKTRDFPMSFFSLRLIDVTHSVVLVLLFLSPELCHFNLNFFNRTQLLLNCSSLIACIYNQSKPGILRNFFRKKFVFSVSDLGFLFLISQITNFRRILGEIHSSITIFPGLRCQNDEGTPICG